MNLVKWLDHYPKNQLHFYKSNETIFRVVIYTNKKKPKITRNRANKFMCKIYMKKIMKFTEIHFQHLKTT